MTISGLAGSEGSLLVPVTLNEPGASPDNASSALTVATVTILLFGGHKVQPPDGIPDIRGGVLSILIVTDAELDRPALLIAEQVRVTPEVSAVRTVVPHPVEEAMPDSGSVKLQFTVTLLRYHPLLPGVPEI